jgi:3-deoxy-7-phosphoheptulonate synthase
LRRGEPRSALHHCGGRQKSGARILRGDAFKPRTSPYAFQGLGEKGLQLLAEARDELGMPFVAEVLDPRDVDLVSSYADLVRIGARNMANFTLLAEVGRQPKPVMLKRGFTATIEEWLNAAEYVYKEGNHNVILCERGSAPSNNRPATPSTSPRFPWSRAVAPSRHRRSSHSAGAVRWFRRSPGPPSPPEPTA